MADIKQAAKWMQEAKYVHRASDSNPLLVYRRAGRMGIIERRLENGPWTSISVLRNADLLADDWELAD